MLANCVDNVLGPLDTDQAPVPEAGLFAASVALVETQMAWFDPALEAVGGALTVMVASAVEAVHGLLVTVQRTT